MNQWLCCEERFYDLNSINKQTNKQSMRNRGSNMEIKEMELRERNKGFLLLFLKTKGLEI